MIALRSLAFALIFYPGTAVCVLIGVITAPLGTEAFRRAALRWSRFHYWCAVNILGIRTRIEGEIPAHPVLYAIKHESMYETLEVIRLFPNPAVLVKKELADIPFWGWIARRHGVIPIDRSGGARALRALVAAARDAVAQNRSLVIFPEGTRVAHGERPPMRAGFAALYKSFGLPVVPVAVDSGRLWPRRRFLKRPGVITFRFGAPIEPGLDRDAAEALVHEQINALND